MDKSSVNVYSDFLRFLGIVADWIKRDKMWGSKKQVCDVIRETQAVFAGVGVYTVSELLFIAGMFIIIVIWII